jgi:hypothetical protein
VDNASPDSPRRDAKHRRDCERHRGQGRGDAIPADHGLSRGSSASSSIRSHGNIPSEWRPPKYQRQDGDANLASKEKSGR